MVSVIENMSVKQRGRSFTGLADDDKSYNAQWSSTALSVRYGVKQTRKISG